MPEITKLPQHPHKPSRRLTWQIASEIWRLRREGHLQHRIAAHLDLNQGRVSEVLAGKRFPEARPD
jgi:hypothetical protein